jgi:hypothetical protein
VFADADCISCRRPGNYRQLLRASAAGLRQYPARPVKRSPGLGAVFPPASRVQQDPEVLHGVGAPYNRLKGSAPRLAAGYGGIGDLEVPMTGTEHDHLRPVERRVLRWAEVGLDDAEIARRFGRSERWVAQVRFLADLNPSAPLDRPEMSARSDTPDRPADRLRPLERRLLRWRRAGVRHEDLSGRFRRSPEFLARVEDYAKYKLAMN